MAAAARVVLDTIYDEGFLWPVRQRGKRLAAGLNALGLDVRGTGLMLGFACPGRPTWRPDCCSRSGWW